MLIYPHSFSRCWLPNLRNLVKYRQNWNPLKFLDESYPRITRGMGLPYGENFIILSLTVFTARCTLVQSAVLRSHVVCLSVRPSVRLSVCLSVCLYVTLVTCDHIGWNSSKIISPLVSPGRSLFATPT